MDKEIFFLIAGEASGDRLGAKLMAELRKKKPEARFVGVGGKTMIESGLEAIFSADELSVMGFCEVLPHLFSILKKIDQVSAKIIELNPDFIITIDSPDFCFRVIKKVKDKTKAKKIHMVAPSVWAYREGRAKKIAKLYDLLLTLLPFEPPYFEKYGLRSVFIGHPITENAPEFSKKNNQREEFRKKYNIPSKHILLCVTPGSRISEVSHIFPQFIGAINLLSKDIKNLSIVIPLVEKTKKLVREMSKEIQIKTTFVTAKERESMLFSCDFALAKSGTNTLELSLYKIPLVVAYKVNLITYIILKIMIKTKFANLVNTILSKYIIPEKLQFKCNPAELKKELLNLISNPVKVREQIVESSIALKILGLGSDKKPSEVAAEEILIIPKFI